MKKIKYNHIAYTLLTAIIITLAVSCKKDTSKMEIATNYPTTPEVFIDAFSRDLKFDAWGKVTAFTIDYAVKYKGTASMKFDIPDASDPAGNFAGGVFYTSMARDLSGYDALTFWAKATQPTTMNTSFGGYPDGPSTFTSALKVALDVKLNSNWQKFVIPIPDPSKLAEMKGMFSYSAGALTDGSGYTIWIDEVKFEKLGTLAHQQPYISGAAESTTSGFLGQSFTITDCSESVSLPNGVPAKVTFGPSYFNFASSDLNVATVTDEGVVTLVGPGAAKITASINGVSALASVTINTVDMPPTPTVDPAKVISLSSDAYTNIQVDNWNPHWTYSTAEFTDINVNGNNIKYYTSLNFVGIVFSSHQVNASTMTFLHMDIMTPNAIVAATKFLVEIDDFGANGIYGGNDDKNIVYTATGSKFTTGNWLSLEIPISGLNPRAHIAQLVLSTEGGMTNVYVDNLYFHK